MRFNQLVSLAENENEAPEMTIEYVDGSKSWYVNGKIHRTDGPAIEWDDGSKEWYLNGEQMSEEEFDKWKAIQKILKDEETGLDLTF